MKKEEKGPKEAQKSTEIVCRTRHKEFTKNNWNASNRWERKNKYHENKKKN
jgi:hypothetical protein